MSETTANTLTETEITKIEFKNILCASCSFIITSNEFTYFVNGQHEYSFKNPSNILYSIRLFSRADGSIDIDSPSIQFTWFPDFAWNFAICSNCTSHLGWKYHSQSNSFFGLITERLKSG
ncbi:MAG: hypothetical protein KBA66_00795 [Leptospiraceae bacterium]|nr:hypothetical protein [Leptospiraceae bacterium]